VEEILITGVSGGLANLVAHRLADSYKVVGVDVRPRRHPEPFPGIFRQVRYQHRSMRDIFRKHDFKLLIHLGRIRNTISTLQKRFDYNVLGTRNLLELCARHGLESALVMSTYHVYGAHQFNPLYLSEESPLRASQIFPELADAVALDAVATAFLWRNRKLRTVILRPANIVGPHIHNVMCQLMRRRVTPTLMGFDPAMQFLHEDDVAHAIEVVARGEAWGIYNLAGEGVAPFSSAIELAGGSPTAIPHFLAYPFVGALSSLGLSFPRHLLDYFKYPTIISDAHFRKSFDWQPKVDTVAALGSVRRP